MLHLTLAFVGKIKSYVCSMSLDFVADLDLEMSLVSSSQISQLKNKYKFIKIEYKICTCTYWKV